MATQNTTDASPTFTPQQSDAADRTVLVTMPAFPRQLAADARAAFGVADAIRLARERAGVGTDHLILGLYARARAAFATAGMDGDALVRLFRATGLDVPAVPVSPDGEAQTRWPLPTALEPTPAVAPAVQRALLAAERMASVRATDARPIGIPHLLRALAESESAIARLLEDVWPAVVASLDARRSASSSDRLVVRTLDGDALDALLPALSQSSRNAIAVADALRRERGADAVHMEHLLVGLHVESGGHQGALLRDSGLAVGVIRGRLQKYELALTTDGSGAAAFEVPARTEPAAMPPLSAHARLALSAAATLGGWSPGTPLPENTFIQAKLFLAAWLAVGECTIVQAFDDARVAVYENVRSRTLGEPADVPWRDGVLARLHTLLVEPSQVVWVPLEGEEDEEDSRPRTGAGGGGTNDRADGVDRLRFGDYVTAFADLIDSPDTDPPLTIGIFGAWGAGKSFLLRKLTKEMRRRREAWQQAPSTRAPVYTVDFNAWEYNAAPQIWPRLVRRVLDSVESSLDWRTRIRIRLRALGPNLRRKAAEDWKPIVAWGVIVALVVVLVRMARAETTVATRTATSTFQFMIGRTIESLTLPGLVGALASLAALLVKSFIAPIGEWITAALDDGRSYGLESVAMGVVRRDLERLDDRMKREGSRVLVVIDDLDRCEPEKAVEMLQAINLLLDRRSFVICLGIDARVVTAAVERHYDQTLGRAGITGYEYLDKIVQIPFTIPEPTKDDLIAFLDGQLAGAAPDGSRRETSERDAPPEQDASDATRTDGTAGTGDTPAATDADAASQTSVESPTSTSANATQTQIQNEPAQTSTAPPNEVTTTTPAAPLSFSDDERAAFRTIAPYLRRNPRHVKRLVNVYTLVRALATRRAERRMLDDPAATVLWLALCAQWPYAVREMLGRFDEHADAKTEPPPTRPPLGILYDAARATLDASRQARFDHDAAVLARLVAISDGLSWDEMRVLRAYTENFNPAIEGELRAGRAAARTGAARGGRPTPRPRPARGDAPA